MQPREIRQNSFNKTFDTLNNKKLSSENILEIKKTIATMVKLNNKINPLLMAIYQEIRTELPEEVPEISTIDKIIDLRYEENENTLLISACLSGHQEIVSELLEAKASLDIKNSAGETALICAASQGYQDIVHELLMAKASIELPNNRGFTALNAAISNNSLATVRVLLEYHARIQHPTQLFMFLIDCDPRDSDVLISLKELCSQYPVNMHKRKRDDVKNNDSHLYLPQKQYLEKLQALEKLSIQKDWQRKTTMNVIRDTIQEMPDVLIDVITTYRDAPLSNLSFFSSSDINTVLNKLSANDSMDWPFFKSATNNNYIEIEIIISKLRETGKNYLRTHSHDQAAIMLKKLLSNLEPVPLIETYVIQKMLESLIDIFNMAQSDLLKTDIKRILTTYKPFYGFNFPEDFNKLIDPSLFKCEYPQLEYDIYVLRDHGKNYLKKPTENQNDREAAEKLSQILSHLAGKDNLTKELIEQELLASLLNIYCLAQSDRLKLPIKEIMDKLSTIIEQNTPRVR